MNMIEKVARAMCSALGEIPDAIIITNPNVEYCWQYYTPAACAAIKAMREPTPQMLTDAGPMIGYEGRRRYADEDHIEWWEDMIDAALNGASA